MKVSTQTLALLGLSGLSNVTAEVVQSGAWCPMSSFVTCKLQNGEPCGSLADQPYESCGMKTLKYDFKYCNNGDENVIKINPKLFVPKINNEVQAENIVKLWPDVPMNTGCRTSATVFKTIDTCANASTAMSLKVEGRRQYPSGTTMEGDGNYCYSWAYLKTKIRANAPDEDAPLADDVPADISMSISCAYESNAESGFIESCNNIAEVMPPNGECMRNVQFKYTCTNNGAVNARLLALVDETNNDLIQDENSVLINARDNWEHTKTVEIDMCKEAGKKVATKATAVAASVPGGMAGTAKASYEVVLPSTEVVYKYVSPGVACKYNGDDCGELAKVKCFSGEVDLTHTIKNVGYTCHNIAKVRTLFNTGGQSRILAIDGSYGCASRLSCPDDVFTFTEKRFINFCDTNGDIPVLITVETDSDDGPSPANTFLQIDATEANLDDDDVEVYVEPALQCNSPPSEMWFEFTHRNCDGSANDQFSVYAPKLRRRGLRHNSSYGASSTKDKKSDKADMVVTEESVIDVISYAGGPVYSCKQLKAFEEDGKYWILITSIDEQTMYWEGKDICTGTDIRIGAENGKKLIASDIMVRIYYGNEEIQQFIMHTGCTNEVIETGQTFGAFKLIGFQTP